MKRFEHTGNAGNGGSSSGKGKANSGMLILILIVVALFLLRPLVPKSWRHAEDGTSINIVVPGIIPGQQDSVQNFSADTLVVKP